jgi:hypothetical protein
MNSAALRFTIALLLVQLGLIAETMAGVPLTITLRNAQTQEPAAARLLVRDSTGWLFAQQDSILFTRIDPWFGPYVHAEDEIIVDVAPGPVEIWAVRGLTGVPVQLDVDVQTAAGVQIDLDRWIVPSQTGWIDADPHIHPWHAGNPYPQPPLEHIGLVGRAEGLDLMFLLANDPAHPSGRVFPAQPGAEFEWGEEYRNSFWGHLVFLDLPQLIATDAGYGCCGDLFAAWPTNQWTLSQYEPPLVLLAHPKPGFDPRDSNNWPGGGFAREMYALALTDDVHGFAVAGASENGDNGWDLEEYLDALRGGARWAAIGEGDRGLNRRSLPPPGVVRTYAHAGVDYPADSSGLAAAWKDAVRRRRSFATTGPFLRFFTVNLVGIGGEVGLGGPANVNIAFNLASLVPIERVTLHGATGVHYEETWPAGRSEIALSVSLPVSHDDFFLLEAEGVSGSWSTDPRGTRLVSTPIWVKLGDPWPIDAELSRRGADTLNGFWEQSLWARGYDNPEDSLVAHDSIASAIAVWEAMFDEDPGAFGLILPDDGKVLATSAANLSWETSRSYDGETTWYEVELDDLDDPSPPFTSGQTTQTQLTIEELTPGHTYSWKVQAYEPGEGPTTSDETRTFEIATSVVAAEPALSLRLSAPQWVGGLARARLELPRATTVTVRWIDLRGRTVARSNRRRAAGVQWIEWDSTDHAGASVANGVYWLVVETSQQMLSRRLTLLR